MLVKKIMLYPIMDSVGNRTMEARIEAISEGRHLELIASSPSGKSAGRHEARTVPIEEGLRFFNKIRSQIFDNHTQESFDRVLRKNSGSLGTHTTTALSLAFYYANIPKKSFPNMLGVVFEGGLHSTFGRGWIQEFLVMPNASSFPD